MVTLPRILPPGQRRYNLPMGRRLILSGVTLLLATAFVIGVALGDVKRSELQLLFSVRLGPDIVSAGEPPQRAWLAGDSLIVADLFAGLSRQAFDGKQQWTYAPDNKALAHLLAVGLNSDSYIGGTGGELIVLSQDGKEKWRRKLAGSREWSVAPAPAADGGVYATVADGHLYALDTFGEQRWHVERDGISRLAPIVSPDGMLIVVKLSDGSVQAYDREGQPRWQSQADIASIYPGLFNSRGEIVFIHPKGLISVIDARTGSLITSINTAGELSDKQALLSDGSICCVRRNTAGMDELLCYDQSGTLRFTRDFDGLFGQLLTVSAGLLVFEPGQELGPLESKLRGSSAVDSKLLLLDTGGQLLNSRPLPCMLLYTNMLDRGDGSVLLYGCDGILYCVEL